MDTVINNAEALATIVFDRIVVIEIDHIVVGLIN